MRQLAFSFLFLLIGGLTTFAGTLVEKDKVIEKEFDISSDGTLELENRYGSVIVTEGNSEKVKIKVTIEVKTSSESKAEEIFDRIKIDFTDTRNFVSAKTEIEDNSGWFTWFSWGSSTDYEINYEISMPSTLFLKVANKYGDIYLPDLNNGLDLTMKYGNVIMRSVEGNTNIDLGYGNIDFGDLSEVNAVIKYSKLRGSSTQELKIDSKYSVVEIGDVAKMKAYSKYDRYEIEKVEEVKNEGKYDTWRISEIDRFTAYTKYTQINIDKLNGDIKIDQKYGSIKVKEMSCGAAEIDFDLEYVDVSLSTNSCGYELDYEGEYTDLNLPSDLRSMVEKDGQDSWLKTKIGNGAKVMKLNMEHGGLKIW